MRRNWTQRLFSMLQGQTTQATAPRAARRSRISQDRHGAYVSRLEVLEPRALLSANVINVGATVNSAGALVITLQDVTGNKSYDTFNVNFNRNAAGVNTPGNVDLDSTGPTNTYFHSVTPNVIISGNGQHADIAFDITKPVQMGMTLNNYGNTVAVNDFAPPNNGVILTALNVNLGGGTNHNGLSINHLHAGTVTIGNSGSSTVGVTVDHSHIGTLNDSELGHESSFATIASLYDNLATINLGACSVVGVYGSPDGPNVFNGGVKIVSAKTSNIYQATGVNPSIIIPNGRPFSLTNVNVNKLAPTIALPTVTDPHSLSLTPTITGTCDPGTVSLVVNVGGTMYRVQTNGLGTWSLPLTTALAPNTATPVTVTAYDKYGSNVVNTGTVTTVTLAAPTINRSDTINTTTLSGQYFANTTRIVITEVDPNGVQIGQFTPQATYPLNVGGSYVLYLPAAGLNQFYATAYDQYGNSVSSPLTM